MNWRLVMALGEFGSLKHIADKNRKITDIFIYKINSSPHPSTWSKSQKSVFEDHEK
jgi:hypothetical protein